VYTRKPQQFPDPAEQLISDVATTIANKLDTEPTDIPPLSNSIDPEAMAIVIGSAEEATLIFTHAQCRIKLSVANGQSRVAVELKPEVEL
jgi:hypothetical protein